MSFTDIVSKFNQQADSHSRSQTLNPFSDRFTQSRSPSPRFSREEYGKPVAGSKTDLRGRKAKSHICREILELCTIIHDVGTYNAKKRDPDDDDHGMDDGTIIVSFGELFQIYTKISDKVVGLLIAAKRRGFLYFDREILFQRQDDDVLIALIKPISEIAKTLKADIEQASAVAAEPTAPAADERRPSTSDGRGTTRERAGTNGRRDGDDNNCNGQVDGVGGGERNSALKSNVVEISESTEDRDGAGAARADAIDPERVGDAETGKTAETRPGGVGAAGAGRAGGTGEDEASGKFGAGTEGSAAVGEPAGGVKTERVEGTGEDEETGDVEGTITEGVEETAGAGAEVKTERATETIGVEGTEGIDGVHAEGVEETRVDGARTEGIEETEGVGGTTTEGLVQRAEGVGGVSTERAGGTGEDEKTGKVEGVGESVGVGGGKTEEVGETKTERAEETVGVEGTEEICGVHADVGVEETEVDGVKIEGVGRVSTEEIEGEKTERVEGTVGDVETEEVEGVEKTEEIRRVTTEGTDGTKNVNEDRLEEVSDVA